MVKFSKIVLYISVLALTGCTSGQSDNAPQISHKAKYPAKVVRSFVESCVSGGGNTKICGCVIEKIQDEMPYKEFTNEDTKARTGQPQDEGALKIKSEALSYCLRQG